MATSQNTGTVTRRRALLTDRERELLLGDDDADDKARYVAISRIRNKIEDELPRDLEILEENHDTLADELRAVVCPDTDAEDETDE